MQEAATLRDQAAMRAIDRIEQITANDGLNDSWWDNWGSKLITGLTKVAELVATVAGIAGLLLCWVPGLGAALLAVSAVAGIGAAMLGAALRTGLTALKTTIASVATRLKHLADGLKRPGAGDFPAQKLDPTNVANGPRLAIQLLAEQIAHGHAWAKHVIKRQEFPEITTHQQFADLIETAITKGEDYFHNPQGKHIYWYEGMFVARNPWHIDGGTAFMPDAGYKYFLDEIEKMTGI